MLLRLCAMRRKAPAQRVGLRRCGPSASVQVVNDFLDDFLTARIGTDILSSQYLAITRPGGPTSVIDRQCDPVAVVKGAAQDAAKLCKYHYGYAPPIDVIDVGQAAWTHRAARGGCERACVCVGARDHSDDDIALETYPQVVHPALPAAPPGGNVGTTVCVCC